MAARRSAVREPVGRRLVVGYLGQWGVYEHFLVKNLVLSGAAAGLDQINYAQGFVTGGRCTVADPHADVDLASSAAESVNGRADDLASPFRGNFHQLRELKRRYPRLKVLISLEGRAPDFAADAQPAAREAFVRSCVDVFLRGHLAGSANVDTSMPDQRGLFDGIDVDWEYPGQENAANFVALLREFRRQMDAMHPGLRLTIAVGPSPRMYPGLDLNEVSRLVDQVGIMNYDYMGPWSHTTGFLAPLYSEGTHGGSVERSILDFKGAGVPARKLLMGLPFYGYGWSSVAAAENGLYQPGQGIRGDRPYTYFQSLLAAPAPVSPSMQPPVNRDAADVEPRAATPPTVRPVAAPASGSEPPSVAARLPPAVDGDAAGAARAGAAPPFLLFREPHSHAPWLFDGSTFWTYEDPTSIRYKAGFAVEQDLGGVMAWELSEDAPDAALLKAARAGLGRRSASLVAAKRRPDHARGSADASEARRMVAIR